MNADVIQWPAVNCQCMVYPENCICSPVEMALRAWSGGFTQPMTPEQRQYCLSEIEQCAEGSNRGDWINATDNQLARGVLSAWKEYAQDKGIIK